MDAVSQLRIFEPADALTAEEQRLVEVATQKGRVFGRSDVVRTEEHVVRRALLGQRQTPTSLRGLRAVETRRVGERLHVCIHEIERRMALEAVVAWRAMPAEVRSGVLGTSASAAEAALIGLDRRLFLREQSWYVPLAWFVAVHPDERRQHEGPGGRVRVLHVTQLAPALERVEDAIDVLEEFDGGPALPGYADLDRLRLWLRRFDERAVVELDYGGLAAQVGSGWLETDRTCRDVHAAIDALRREDLLGAAAAYARARSQWSDRWSFASRN